MQVEFPSSALKAAADAAASAGRPDRIGAWDHRLPSGGVEKSQQVSFGDLLMDALKDISNTQTVADRQQRAFEVGEPGATLESTMVSMQKAQIGFQSALTVRNRLVQAYSEIMSMQV
ncbi:MAG: flagellar hook-basal body complex protein FliE [Lautropia sp.]|nr:flagellar hook-basal body complex protein FliE [Lautropia sp.]